jgi:hypothetical protein
VRVEEARQNAIEQGPKHTWEYETEDKPSPRTKKRGRYINETMAIGIREKTKDGTNPRREESARMFVYYSSRYIHWGG